MSELDNLDPLAIPDEWWQQLGDYIGNLPDPSFRGCD